MEIVIAWIIFAPLVGVLSSERGTGFWTGFLPSLAFSPVVGLIIVLVLRKPDGVRRAEIEKEERMRAEVRAQIEAEARGEAPPAADRASRGKPARAPNWPE